MYGVFDGFDDIIQGSEKVTSDIVPQIKIVCLDDSKDFNCTISEKNLYPDHTQNTGILCMDIDPANPDREPGVYELTKPFKTASGGDNYPVI